MDTIKIPFTAVIAAVLLAAAGAAAQQPIDLAPIFGEPEMANDLPRPPARPAAKSPLRTRAIVNVNFERDKAMLAKGYRDDHPAYEVAKANTARKNKGK